MREDYDTDLYAWANRNAALLRVGRLTEIDTLHIAEELEDMGKSERRALRGHLRNLTLHLLKWRFQPSHRGVSWRLSIRNARLEIQAVLRDSPSLKPLVDGMLAEEYAAALANALDETGLPEGAFPPTCPYTSAQVLDQAYWPDA